MKLSVVQLIFHYFNTTSMNILEIKIYFKNLIAKLKCSLFFFYSDDIGSLIY